jgi:hypothetical protein
VFSDSAASSLVTIPTEISRLRVAVQMAVTDLYIEGLQLKRRFEILTEVLNKIQVFLEIKSTKCKIITRLFEISLLRSLKKCIPVLQIRLIILNLIYLISAVWWDAQHVLAYTQSDKCLCT